MKYADIRGMSTYAVPTNICKHPERAWLLRYFIFKKTFPFAKSLVISKMVKGN